MINFLPTAMQAIVGQLAGNAFGGASQVAGSAMPQTRLPGLLNNLLPNGSVLGQISGGAFGGNPAANGQFGGAMGKISQLGGTIDQLKNQLMSGKGPDGKPLTDSQKFALQQKLQKAVQERQQVMTLLSNLLKSQHDLAMRIIGNIR